MTERETSERVHEEDDEDASEAQAQVIASLRAQVTDLFSQVTQLNGKLVASYDRVSDLEDQLHDTSSSLRNASVTISSLELERSHHLAALNTGLLVEKAHVTAELNRLMERATEEAAQRGQAESARQDIEKDLDDLSATLFDQANTMVAEARLSQARSERKVQGAEQALKIAEDAVKDMQVQMQTLQAEKETAESKAREAKITMGKGKWIEREDMRVGEVPRIRFMTTHAPYAEFVAFVGQLRGLRVSQPTPPVMSTLLSQPFIARLINEDSEPTVRLDLAPSLNWLSRRSVLAAIHSGMLTVEPVAYSSLVQELHQHPQSTSSSTLSCALCGTLIARIPSTTPVSRTHSTNGSSWFKYPLALASAQNLNAGTPQPAELEPPSQVYIFRLATATASSPPALAPTHTSSVSMSGVGPSSRPPLNISSRVIQAQTQNSTYPLCTSNYCLTRLRSTCSLWAFVRVGIVERVWEEEAIQPPKPHVSGHHGLETPPPPTTTSTTNQSASGTTSPAASEKPPVPPRRRRLWEMASALGERAVSWGKESGEYIKEKDSTKKIPQPPPSHPSAPHPHAMSSSPLDGPAPPPPCNPSAPHPHPESPTSAATPPPLPKRSVVRSTDPADTITPLSNEQGGATTEETKEPTTGDAGKTERNASDFPMTPVSEITFAAPPCEASPPPSAALHLVAAPELSAPPLQGHPPPPSPHTIPLPATPTTPPPMARATSPVPRTRSRLSSPVSPPPSSRPASPAINRSRAGSPAPAGIARAGSPSPGYAPSPSTSPLRRKASVGSPLAPPGSRPASPAPGPGAPPLPRRAAARRAVPPPPSAGKVVGEGKEEVVSPAVAPSGSIHESRPSTAGETKVAEAGAKEEGVSSTATVAAAADPNHERDARNESEVEAMTEKKGGDAEVDGEVKPSKQDDVPEATSVAPTTTEAAPEHAKDATVGDAQGAVNGISETAASDPHPASASEGYVSMDTASTKHSSITEGEGFASDATWEERTWKELARLKEEMFWARVGGIRAIHG